ncbi:GIG1 family protein, partial [Acetobacter pasteurianus]|nr:GIG1 family protein [Acetobacter pasteurianus]
RSTLFASNHLNTTPTHSSSLLPTLETQQQQQQQQQQTPPPPPPIAIKEVELEQEPKQEQEQEQVQKQHQLNTPPRSPSTTLDLASIYKRLNIRIHHSPLMPQPSKIKHGSPFSWDDIVYISNTNQLELFARSEEQTNDYHKFKQYLKDNNITINDYILKHELHWKQSDLRLQQHVITGKSEYSTEYPQDLIFHNVDDLKILPNKYPYYFDKNIAHLCVWSKLTIPNDVNSTVGDISPLTRRIVDKYLEKTLGSRGVTKDQFVWFRNWSSLQSVRSISHIHVILRDVDPKVIDEVMQCGGTPLSIEEYREILNE